MRRWTIHSSLFALFTGVVLATVTPTTSQSKEPADATHALRHSSSAVTLNKGMQKLWQDHVLWTRLVIVGTAAGLPDLDATTQRLLQNQDQIGDAVKPYYGDEAGTKLAQLLHTHILGAAAVLAAAKANDATKLTAAKTSWYANANEIADFLSAANPKNWPKEHMEEMMRRHLDLTLTEATDQLQGKYAESVADYDRVQDEILQMADALTEGIVKQFPAKF